MVKGIPSNHLGRYGQNAFERNVLYSEHHLQNSSMNMLTWSSTEWPHKEWMIEAVSTIALSGKLTSLHLTLHFHNPIHPLSWARKHTHGMCSSSCTYCSTVPPSPELRCHRHTHPLWPSSLHQLQSSFLLSYPSSFLVFSQWVQDSKGTEFIVLVKNNNACLFWKT